SSRRARIGSKRLRFTGPTGQVATRSKRSEKPSRCTSSALFAVYVGRLPRVREHPRNSQGIPLPIGQAGGRTFGTGRGGKNPLDLCRRRPRAALPCAPAKFTRGGYPPLGSRKM